MKKIFSLIISACILCTASAAVHAADENVSAAGGTVTINYETAKADTPVVVLVIPEKIVDEADVTLESLSNFEDLDELELAYFKVVKTNSEGTLIHTCKMTSALPTGVAHVYISYLDSEGWIKAGEFEHVKRGDIDTVLGWFNSENADYAQAIVWDEEGKDNQAPIKVLRKSSAKIDEYNALDTNKEEFISVLKSKKPADGFDIVTLTTLFNESLTWMKLRLESDTLSVLAEYNGKIWNIPLSDADDFSKLSAEEQSRILANIKNGKHADKTTMLDDFNKNLALSFFREVDSREELESVISESGTYGSYFEDVRQVLKDADLSDFERLEVLNEVLDSNSTCEKLSDVAEIFEETLPEESNSGGGSSGGGSSTNAGRPISVNNRGGSVSLIKTPDASKVTTGSFTDVKMSDWFYDYIERLYKKNVINGTQEGVFSPAESVKRRDFIKILVGALEFETVNKESVFVDVEKGGYYEPFIMTAVENNLIFGTGEGKFGAETNITRQDAAVIIGRVLKMHNTESAEIATPFADKAEISEYALVDVKMAAANRIFSGDENNHFNPKAELSRAEACAVLCRLADLLKGGVE